ncbi:MAG: hypothetical protein ACRELT_07790 [Longimicrobiales bacterium]
MPISRQRARALRRRNVFTAVGLALLAPTFVVHATEEGMQWALWRDEPLLGLLFVAAAVGCGILAWRSRP